jgi:hypothetical protein
MRANCCNPSGSSSRADGVADVEFKTSEIRFWGEQDGPSERILKDELAPLFEQHGEIRSAYLMLVDYGENTQTVVALCLDAGPGQHSALREKIQTVFGALFREGAHLDILFVTDDGMLGWLRTNCSPFYQTETSSQQRNEPSA